MGPEVSTYIWGIRESIYITSPNFTSIQEARNTSEINWKCVATPNADATIQMRILYLDLMPENSSSSICEDEWLSFNGSEERMLLLFFFFRL